MKYRELDIVKTKVDLPGAREDGAALPAGSSGTIVMAFSSPYEAYEVEFLNDDGETIAMLPLKPEQIEPDA